MNKLKTSLAFAKNLLTTGAVTQTSQKVEREIRAKIPSDKKLVIVEYGMGHGNITQAVLDNISKDSKLYSFEVNEKFCKKVGETIKDDRLNIVNSGAETLDNHVPEEVDYFVSSLPLSFFSKEMLNQILTQTYKKLKNGGSYSQILYTKNHRKKFEPIFNEVEIVSYFNIPPENIYHCKKVKA